MASIAQLRDVLTYPKNLQSQVFWNCSLDEYNDRLEKESERVLQHQPYAAVDFLTSVGGIAGFSGRTIRDETEMLDVLNVWSNPQLTPRCQYVSIHAPSSRKKLCITKPMLQVLLSHYRTMPCILDFIFAFGRNSQAENFNFSSFRTEEALMPSHSFQICYNLRDVEPSSRQPDWPWSIRQTAISHGFDLQTGDSTWITIKGNKDMSNKFKQFTEHGAPLYDPVSSNSTTAFQASLISHLVICEWSRQNWARYIGYLEYKLQNRTKYAVLATVNHPSPEHEDGDPVRPTHTNTTNDPGSIKKSPTWAERRRVFSSRVKSWVVAGTKPESDSNSEANELLPLMEKKRNEYPEYKDFSYDDLRDIHFTEDKANQCLLAIRSNTSILKELDHHYHNLRTSEEFKDTLGSTCNAGLDRFYKRISLIISDLKNQQSRLEMLLQSIGHRKALLFGLFDHRNMSTNKELAMESRESARKMEVLNIQMKDIATKTESETIVMRIVTLATLFFLPGTFVATLLSTDIVKFEDNGELMHKFSWLALLVYLGLTIPIMIVTFCLAYKYMRKEQLKVTRDKDGAAMGDKA